MNRSAIGGRAAGVVQGIAQAYDRIPYYQLPFHRGHPVDMAVRAAVLGLHPTPPARARVLDIACGRGANLVAVADMLPDSHCLGIDLSARHIEDARALALAAEVHNVQFEHLDILDVQTELGEFDYILVHGVYSWVPENVQQRIMEICGSHLSEHGLVAINYALYPHSRQNDVVRELMLYHIGGLEDPEDRLRAAEDLLRLLSENLDPATAPYASVIRQQAESARKDPRNFYHEYLNLETRPMYFHEFARRAADQGLQYVAELSGPLEGADLLPLAAREALSRVADVVRREQYSDFLVNRGSRHSLLCRAGRNIHRAVTPDSLKAWLFSSQVSPLNPLTELDDGAVRYKLWNEITVDVRSQRLRAALRVLRQHWPKALSYDALAAASETNMKSFGIVPSAEDSDLARELLFAYRYGAVELHRDPPACVDRAGEYPEAHGLARVFVERGLRQVVNLRHEAPTLEDYDLRLLPLLDGQHDRHDLVQALIKQAETGQLSVRERGEPVLGVRRLETLIESQLERALEKLARWSLLVG